MMRARSASNTSSVTLACESAMEKVFATPELVRLIGRAVFDAVKVQHPDWIPERSGVPPASCAGGFAPARFACVSKTCHEQMFFLWCGPTFPSRDWATRHILESVKNEMSITATMEWDRDSDDSEDSDGYDDDRYEDGPWTYSDPALVIGVKALYKPLRVAVCVGRRFYRIGNELTMRSQKISETLPSNVRRSAVMPDLDPLEAGNTEAEFIALLETWDGASYFKYAMPARIEEISKTLEARGSAFGGALKLTGTGSMSDADEDVLLGIKIGDIPARYFFYNMMEEIYDACSDYEELKYELKDVMFDIEEPMDSYLEQPLSQYAPPYFLPALFASVLATFAEVAKVAGPSPAADVPELKDVLGPLSYIAAGGAGGQGFLKHCAKQYAAGK